LLKISAEHLVQIRHERSTPTDRENLSRRRNEFLHDGTRVLVQFVHGVSWSGRNLQGSFHVLLVSLHGRNVAAQGSHCRSWSKNYRRREKQCDEELPVS
jgi:hypothetical protein